MTALELIPEAEEMPGWMATEFALATPLPASGDATDWMEKHVRLVGSARKEEMDFSVTPWSRPVARAATSGRCKTVTFIKPVQSGGSAVGEACLCYWIANENGGDLQYNWEDDQKALKRWDERVERIFKKCGPLMDRAPSLDKSIGAWSKCSIQFAHCNFTMQGIFVSKRLDSDTIRFQVNEEIHNWEEGTHAKAEKRLTAVWNRVQFNISNAGKANGQLHRLFKSGTMRRWQVKCPSCGEYHTMRTRFDPKKPELGGLRYDSEGCRIGQDYDYNKLAPTIRYQMPCGAELKDDPVLRRQMSLSGRYSAPENPGATADNESFTLEAVSVDYIRWLDLIKEKHEALSALKTGDPKPYWTYMRERESEFVDEMNDRPIVGRIQVTIGKKKREGLEDRIIRFGALDRQQGSLKDGEFPHWWAVIRDFNENMKSMLVWEGKLLTDEDAAAIMFDHQILPTCVVSDSGDDTSAVYQFCLKHGFSAIKGSGENDFAHPDGSRRIYSVEKPLYLMTGGGPTRDNKAEEPLFWFYSKSGIRERLHWLRGASGIEWLVPGDVSEDYKAHMEAEELQTRLHTRTKESISEWVQLKRRNDLFVCECYIAMEAEQAKHAGAFTLK